SQFIFIDEPQNIFFDQDDINNFQTFGCYFSNTQGGRIHIGSGTYIAPNVGIITTDHDPKDPSRHLVPQDVIIGSKCWIGMNAVVLPGVTLGDHTTVAAGAVVKDSFPEGNCVLAGVPARVVKRIDL
ncbi:MAG: DapH/DapD/GlmU-related protein, partial [Candidatus Saccharibacteria bacterium]